jgi:hypothetical protein
MLQFRLRPILAGAERSFAIALPIAASTAASASAAPAAFAGLSFA